MDGVENADRMMIAVAVIAVLACVLVMNNMNKKTAQDGELKSSQHQKKAATASTAAKAETTTKPKESSGKSAPTRSRKMSLDYEAGTHTTVDAPKQASTRSRKMSLDYEAGTHTTLDSPKSPVTSSRKMSLDYGSGTHTTVPSKKAPVTSSRKMSLDYGSGTHKLENPAELAEVTAESTSHKPGFDNVAEERVAETAGDSSAAAPKKGKKSGKGKPTKSQEISDEIERLTREKLQLEQERLQSVAPVTLQELRQIAEDSQEWETVGGKSKKSKKSGKVKEEVVLKPTGPAVPGATFSTSAKPAVERAVTETPAAAAAAAAITASAPPVVSAAAAPGAAVVRYVKVPGKKLGGVIGTKGANIIALQDAYQVTIQTPKVGTDSSEEVAVSVSGDSTENVNKVAKAVADLANKGYSGLLITQQSSTGNSEGAADRENVFMERTMQVPSRMVPDIIGKNGAHIKALQEKTGCRVNVTNNTNVVNDIQYSRVSMAGTKAQITQVKGAIKDLEQYHHSALLMPEQIHVELDNEKVPSDMYSVLIGTKGSERKHIQGNFRVSLYVPQADSVNQNVVLVGSEEGVLAAERYIYKSVAAVQERVQNNELRGYRGDDAAAAVQEPVEEELEPWAQKYVKSSDGAELTQNDFSAVVTKALRDKKK